MFEGMPEARQGLHSGTLLGSGKIMGVLAYAQSVVTRVHCWGFVIPADDWWPEQEIFDGVDTAFEAMVDAHDRFADSEAYRSVRYE